MNQDQNLTWDDIKEMFAEAARMSKENEKSFKETDLKFKETDKKFKESARGFKETKRLVKETTLGIKELKVQVDGYFREIREVNAETDRRLDRLGKYLGGVSHSNGDMAEEFFYNTLRKDKIFVNQHFDDIKRNLHYKGVDDDLEMECDILLFNGKSAAMIEVKYNAKPDNVKVDNIAFRIAKFKLFFPEYANHKIYFGVAAMSFKKGFAKVLHKAGFATIRPFGKKIVIYDKEVKEF